MVIPVGIAQYEDISWAAGPQEVVSHAHNCQGTGGDPVYQSSAGLKAAGETPHQSGYPATGKEPPPVNRAHTSFGTLGHLSLRVFRIFPLQ